MDVQELQTNSDWAEIFGEGSSCWMTWTDEDEVISGDEADVSRIRRCDVANVVAAKNGAPGASEWMGVFRLRDGRFAIVIAICGVGGWSEWFCNAEIIAFKSLESLLASRWANRIGELRLDIESWRRELEKSP